jgi:hypothetical protein
MSGHGRLRLVDGAWLVAGALASSLWCILASQQLSSTFDEPTYIRLGLESWHTGKSGKLLDLGTMPLPMHVDTLPLYLWERWRGELFDLTRDFDLVLPVARLGTLPFWWLLLLYGFLVARHIAGDWGGRLAVVFLSFDPNLLAHATLATSDVPLSACLVALFYHFQRGREGPWRLRVGLPAIWFALSVLCKASGLMFGVLGLMAVASMGRPGMADMPNGQRWPHTILGRLWGRHLRRDLAQITGLGLLGVFMYCGSDGRVSPSFVEWARGIPEGPGSAALVWCAEHLRIFSNAGVGLVRQVRHNIQGHGVYLLGQVAPRSFWYYFPTALSIKCPIPLLALPFVLICAWPRALGSWACRIVGVFLLFSLLCRVQIGIRLVLPLIALCAVALPAALVVAYAHLQSGPRRGLLAGVAVLGCVWTVGAATVVWPNGLCYTNELWGGTANGYRLLSDSNYDWGQGLRELAEWQSRHRIGELDVLPYGGQTALEPLRLRRLPLSNFDGITAEDAGRCLRGRTVAIGATILFGSLGELSYIKPLVALFRDQTPLDRTSTFFIYHVPEEPARRP